MATTTPVRAGDLITAQFINDLLIRIADLEASVGPGVPAGVTVPRLVGMSIFQAQGTLSSGFFVAIAVDALGNPINPNLNENRQRIILNQVPAPGMRSDSPGAIDVVVSAVAGTGPVPTPGPTLSGFSPAVAPINSTLQIFGNNLGSPTSVTVDSMPAAILANQSTPIALAITVPPITPVPPADGRVATIIVTTAHGSVSSASLPQAQQPRIGPQEAGQPTVSRIVDVASGAEISSGGGVVVDSRIRIEGTNFDQPSVLFLTSGAETAGTNPSVAAGAITVTVPRLPQHSATNESVPASLVVQSGSGDSALRSEPFDLFVDLE